jgi:hypothetical protein
MSKDPWLRLLADLILRSPEPEGQYSVFASGPRMADRKRRPLTGHQPSLYDLAALYWETTGGSRGSPVSRFENRCTAAAPRVDLGTPSLTSGSLGLVRTTRCSIESGRPRPSGSRQPVRFAASLGEYATRGTSSLRLTASARPCPCAGPPIVAAHTAHRVAGAQCASARAGCPAGCPK